MLGFSIFLSCLAALERFYWGLGLTDAVTSSRVLKVLRV